MDDLGADPLLGPVTLAIDHVKAMRACISGDVSSHDLGIIKQQLAEASSVSVLTDPEHGLDLVRSSLGPTQTLVVSIEDGDYATPELAPRLLTGWNAARIAAAGAGVIKCFFWYEPGPRGKQARSFLAKVASACDAAKVPLIAEPILVDAVGGGPTKRHGDQLLETVRELNDSGAAALKLEFPGGHEGSAEQGIDISGQITELSVVPWYVLSQGVSFEIFKQQLHASMAGGASGCVVGRAVWGDLINRHGVNNGGQQILSERLATLLEVAAQSSAARLGPQGVLSENEL